MKLSFQAEHGYRSAKQLIRILQTRKLVFILSALFSMPLSAKTTAQKFTIVGEKLTLEQVFEEIKKQSDYLFWYELELIKAVPPVNLQFRDASLDQVMNHCLKNTILVWQLVNSTIVIKQKSRGSNPPAVPGKNTIKGRVTSESGEPLSGATIQVKTSPISTTTNDNGEFELAGVEVGAILIVSSVSFETLELKLTNLENLHIRLKIKSASLDSVVVSYNTGYQYIAKERATGSFTHIDNELINRSVSTNILDRLHGVASGVLFDTNTGTSTGMSVRGRSTIFANADPLVVLDNFPYDGELSTINPNDVESITILKDAAAASIWGARASNGVIVITTKKGRLNQPIRVSFNANINITERPNLNAIPEIGSKEVIEVEKFLYNNGHYAGYVWTPYVAPSESVAILEKQTNGTLTELQANAQLNNLALLNNKDDLLKYYNRSAMNQQYALNIHGGGESNKYYLSFGYDKNLENIKTNTYNRITINAANTYALLNKRLEINAGINLAISQNKSNGTGTYVNRPYAMLSNSDGSPKEFNFYRQEWTDTIGGGYLLDWKLRPLEEIRSADNKTNLTNYLLNLGVKYKIFNGLEANLQYQYSKGITDREFYNPVSSFLARNQINSFSSIDYSNFSVKHGIPVGDILSFNNSTYQSHNIRGQLAYNNDWNRHLLTVMAGGELKDYTAFQNAYTLYGYEKETATSVPVDFANYQRQIFTSWATGIVPGSPNRSGAADRYISFFGNAAYTYDKRYTISVSARKDESNLFGVNTNQKGVPLWSAGAVWHISNESFYNLKWLPELKLRVTNGVNGNVDKSVSAYTTLQTGPNNIFNQPVAYLLNPPNPSLRWEKVNVTNLAIDFRIKQTRLSGSIEYYQKKAMDLIGFSPLAPQVGVRSFKGNAADMSARGIDLLLNSINIEGKFNWQTILLFNYNVDKITNYKVNTSALSLHEGYPYAALFSYRWAGLDAETGDPMGYLGKEVSKAYGVLVNTDSLGVNTAYNGTRAPKYFGSIRNTLSWKTFSLSINLLYKAGHRFRRPSISYQSLFNTLSGHIDYNHRWQNPGDEKLTDVPSMVYTWDGNRDVFFQNAENLVRSAGILRLQDIRLDYRLNTSAIKSSAVKFLTFYMYASNLATIWTENKERIDPEHLILPLPKSVAIGLKADF